MKQRYISLDGKIVSYNKGCIHITSAALKYGASIFEGIRGYWNAENEKLCLFALDAHLNRLFDSLKLMQMDYVFTKAQIINQIESLIIANNLREDSYIRCAASIIGTGGIDSRGPVLLSIDAFPQGRKAKHKEGIHVCISSWIRVADTMMPPRIKCIANYQNGRLATFEAKSNNYDDAILLNQTGKIAESPTASVCFIKNNALITPALNCDILESITRRFIINIAREMELEVIERGIDRSECYLAEEAFLCGTGCEILPILSIDRHPLGNGNSGNITDKLKMVYNAIVRDSGSKFNGNSYFINFHS
jgi:branched-chain amino acid aminotransferase